MKQQKAQIIRRIATESEAHYRDLKRKFKHAKMKDLKILLHRLIFKNF